jgi:hypothetical protein
MSRCSPTHAPCDTVHLEMLAYACAMRHRPSRDARVCMRHATPSIPRCSRTHAACDTVHPEMLAYACGMRHRPSRDARVRMRHATPPTLRCASTSSKRVPPQPTMQWRPSPPAHVEIAIQPLRLAVAAARVALESLRSPPTTLAQAIQPHMPTTRGPRRVVPSLRQANGRAAGGMTSLLRPPRALGRAVRSLARTKSTAAARFGAKPRSNLRRVSRTSRLDNHLCTLPCQVIDTDSHTVAGARGSER